MKKITLLFLCLTIFLMACGGKREESVPEIEVPPETAMDSEIGETKIEVTEDLTEESRIMLGDEAGKISYEVKILEKAYEAEDGTIVCSVKVEYPVITEDTEGIRTINAFYEKWAQETMNSYSEDEQSTVAIAMEVYRESRDASWLAPWEEDYTVASVSTYGPYVSVFHDAYMYEGGNHGMPYRTVHTFLAEDGSEVKFTDMTKIPDETVLEIIKNAFINKINTADMHFFENARKTVLEMQIEDIKYYLSEEGVVFYFSPYEIAPYSSGYIEVKIPYAEIGM